MVTLKQLRYLEAIARTGHFGRAAEAVHISQPALSAQIRVLEDTLGVALLERMPTGAKLTHIGEEIARRGRLILASVGELQEAARQNQGLLAGPLKLGIIPSIAPYLLPQLLPVLDRSFPALKLDLRETITEQLLKELIDGALDVVVVSLPVSEPSLATCDGFFDPFVMACAHSRDITTSARGRLPKKILNQETLLLLEDGHCLRDQTLAVWKSQLAPGERGGGVSNMATLTHLVEQDRGVALLPDLFLQAEPAQAARVRLLRFEEPQPGRHIGLAWRKTHPRGEGFPLLGAALREAGQRAAASGGAG